MRALGYFPWEGYSKVELSQMAVVIPAGYLKQPCLLELNNNHKLKSLIVVWYSDSSNFPNLNCFLSIPDETAAYFLSENISGQWVGHVQCGVLRNSGNLLIVAAWTVLKTVLALFYLSVDVSGRHKV